MKKNKLVIVQPALGRYRKGFVESLVDINADEFDISIYCSPVDNLGVMSMDNVPANIKYVQSKLVSIFGVFFWQCFFFKIISLKLKQDDVFVFNGNPRFLSSMILALWLKSHGADVIWWGHGRSSTSTKLGSFIRFRLMSLFRVMLYTEKEVNELSTFLNSPMCGLNNGLDVDAIRASYSHDIAKYDSELLNIAFIGRLTEKSQFGLLLKAMLSLPLEVSSKFRLNIIGNVDYNELLLVEPAIKRLNIQCFGEVWEESKVTEILSDCHIFIYPGSVGLSIIHAFALGLPAIVHDRNDLHMPEIGCFEDGYNGSLFDCGSYSSLSNKLIEISSNREVLKQYSLNAYDTVTMTFNTKDMAKRFFKFIRN